MFSLFITKIRYSLYNSSVWSGCAVIRGAGDGARPRLPHHLPRRTHQNPPEHCGKTWGEKKRPGGEIEKTTRHLRRLLRGLRGVLGVICRAGGFRPDQRRERRIQRRNQLWLDFLRLLRIVVRRKFWGFQQWLRKLQCWFWRIIRWRRIWRWWWMQYNV